jgi:hypothetical protein
MCSPSNKHVEKQMDKTTLYTGAETNIEHAEVVSPRRISTKTDEEVPEGVETGTTTDGGVPAEGAT